MKTLLHKLICLRCGYRWLPRVEPVTMCPQCKSRNWHQPKAKRKPAKQH